jgi:hypothetical protein
MTRAAQSGKGVGLLRTIEALTPLAQVDPSVLDTFNADEIAPDLAEINGVPHKWIRSKDEVAALRQGRAQAQQAQQLLQAAPVVSGAIKDISEVQRNQQAARF